MPFRSCKQQVCTARSTLLLFLVRRTAQHEFTRIVLLAGASSPPLGPCSDSTAIVRGDPRSVLQFLFDLRADIWPHSASANVEQKKCCWQGHQTLDQHISGQGQRGARVHLESQDHESRVRRRMQVSGHDRVPPAQEHGYHRDCEQCRLASARILPANAVSAPASRRRDMRCFVHPRKGVYPSLSPSDSFSIADIHSYRHVFRSCVSVCWWRSCECVRVCDSAAGVSLALSLSLCLSDRCLCHPILTRWTKVRRCAS